MNDRFTQRVRKVLFLAREEAGRMQHDYIGTEHLLLGIIREGEGIAAQVIKRLGIDFEQIQRAVEEIVSPQSGAITIGEIPFTPRAKRVLELSIDEARLHSHNYVGTEHLLLALIKEGEGVAARVLDQARRARELESAAPFALVRSPEGGGPVHADGDLSFLGKEFLPREARDLHEQVHSVEKRPG